MAKKSKHKKRVQKFWILNSILLAVTAVLLISIVGLSTINLTGFTTADTNNDNNNNDQTPQPRITLPQNNNQQQANPESNANNNNPRDRIRDAIQNNRGNNQENRQQQPQQDTAQQQPEAPQAQQPQAPSRRTSKRFFRLAQFRSDLQLYRENGLPYTMTDEHLARTKMRFSVYRNGMPLSDFDLEFDNNLDLSDVISGINTSDVKSFIHSDAGIMQNRTLYVPRRPEHTQVRVCAGARNYNDIYEGCIERENVTAEYVLTLDSPRLTMTDDEQFFIVHGISGTGAVSEGNTRLIIYDDTDSSTRVPGQLVKFYANYSDTTTDAPIQGANIFCNITFEDVGEWNMSFNADTNLYTYNRTFSTSSVYNFNVSCFGTALGYQDLNVSDYASIGFTQSTISGPENISRFPSERGNENLAGTIQTAQGQNVTPISITTAAITNFWQGYFGNITNTIALSDANNNSIYEWASTSPTGEVFATRAFDVNFPTVACTTQEQIYIEEQDLGQTNLTTDRVNATFNRTIHPAFSVGTTSFTADTCRSTNTFVSDQHQEDDFYEVLLSDGAENVIYTAIVDADTIGFNGRAQDFQMLVGENNYNDTEVTNYYFFVELT